MKTLSEFNYVDAKTVDEAVSALSMAGNSGMVMAGGTDLIGALRFHILKEDPQTIVSLKNVSPSLDYIKEEGGMLKIGAMTRLEDIAKSDVVHDGWTALAEAAQKAVEAVQNNQSE